jgi:hypothetical protein
MGQRRTPPQNTSGPSPDRLRLNHAEWSPRPPLWPTQAASYRGVACPIVSSLCHAACGRVASWSAARPSRCGVHQETYQRRSDAERALSLIEVQMFSGEWADSDRNFNKMSAWPHAAQAIGAKAFTSTTFGTQATIWQRPAARA